MAMDLHNPNHPLDVNNDLQVTAADALEVIHWINRESYGGNDLDATPLQYPDVNGDGKVSAMDALAVINRLTTDLSRSSMLRLKNDTAPGNQQNNDRISSDVTLEVLIVNKHLGLDQYALRGTDETGDDAFLDLSEYLQEGVFEVPGSSVSRIFHDINTIPVNPFKAELVAHTGDPFGNDAKVLTELAFVYDSQAPVVYIPDKIDASAESASFKIFEPSGVTDESLATLQVRPVGAGAANPAPVSLVTTHDEPWVTDVDIPLSQWEFENDSEHLDFQLDGIIEDIAGNKTILPVRRAIPRVESSDVEASQEVAVLPEDLRPSSGYAFDTSIPSLVAGQSVSVYIPRDLVDWYFWGPVVTLNNDAQPTLGAEKIQVRYNWETGIAEFTLPYNATSGELTNLRGQSVFSYQVIPHPRLFNLVNLSDRLRSTTNVGGLSLDEPWFVYRTFDTDEIIHNSTQVKLTRADVAGWDEFELGSQVVHGFATAQIASANGVTNPFLVNTLALDSHTLTSFALADDKSAVWGVTHGTLIKIDFLSGNVLQQVDLQALLTDAFGRDLDEPLSDQVVDVHVIPRTAFADRVQHTANSKPSIPESVVAARLAFPILGSQWVLLDPSDGTLIGRVTDNLDYTESDYHSITVYNPDRNTWFQVRDDNSGWREISLETGDVTAAGEMPSGIEFAPHQIANDRYPNPMRYAPTSSGYVFWNPVTHRVRYKLPISQDSRVKTVEYEFDPSTEAFELSDTPIRAGFSGMPRLSRAVMKDGWLYTLGKFGSSDTGFVSRIGAAHATANQDASAGIDEFRSTALQGTATNPDVASANPGQTIQVRGRNLREGMLVTFENDSLRIYSSLDLYKTGVSQARLFDVSADGAQAKVTVPFDATTAEVRLDRNPSDGILLQIVPVIIPRFILQGDIADRESRLFNYDISGLTSEHYSIHINGQLWFGCESVWDDTCQPLAKSYYTPLLTSSIEVATRGGYTRVDFPVVESVDQPLVIESVETEAIRFAADYVYEGLAPDEVLAGAALSIGVSSSGIDASPAPHYVRFLFRENVAGEAEQQLFVQTGCRMENGRYLVETPFYFRGGTIEIYDEESIAGAHDAVRYPLRVAPTVIGASGDSALPGSTILLAGVNVASTRITIDDIPVEVTSLAANQRNEFDILEITVPDTVTQGTIKIDRHALTATAGRLAPWWDVDDMPRAEFGTPNYASLPSANPAYEVEFTGSYPGVASESGDLSKYLPSRIIERRIERSIWAAPLQRLEGDGFKGRLSGSAKDGLVIFGDKSGRTLNLLPIVPVLEGVQVLNINSGNQYDEPWINIGFKRQDLEHVTLVWGSREWELSQRTQYRQTDYGATSQWSIRYDEASTSPVKRFVVGNEYVVDITSGDSSRRIAGIPVGVWIGPETNPELPTGPIAIKNRWGVSDWAPADSQETGVVEASFVAEHGTPANPDLPSVNVGQELVLPDSFGDRLDGVFFQRYQKSSSSLQRDKAFWTAATNFELRRSYWPQRLGAGYFVPRQARTGWMRVGLLGRDSYVQIVPTLKLNTYTPSNALYMTGVDQGDYLRIGERIVTLSTREIESEEFIFDYRDPRLAGLQLADLLAGVSVVSAGGESEVVQVPFVSGVLVNSIPVSATETPIRVHAGDIVTLLGHNFDLLQLDKSYNHNSFYNLVSVQLESSDAENAESALAFRLASWVRPGQFISLAANQGSLFSMLDLQLLFVP